MKKMLLAVSVCCFQYAGAQTTIDFEELTVPGADSAWLGSDGTGGFTSHQIFFPNTFNTQFSYWENGFIYSNSTDNTTAGYTNDYSSYVGSGAANSNNYVVNFGEIGIDFATEKHISSIALSNNTYAALSMRDGDAFGKQFGSVNNAQGNPDGTNGEDFFRLLLIGKDAAGNVTDTVTFYLADYRFSDNSQDYIVDTWETVDLTPLGAIRYLDFKLQSSDVGSFGNNTPSYFAMDNLVISGASTASIDQAQIAPINIYPNPSKGIFNVKAEKGNLRIVSATGQCVFEQTIHNAQQIDLTHIPAGMYVVEFANELGQTRTRIQKI